MALRGRAVGLGLEEVVNFLAEAQLEGTLEVRRGEEASLRVYFRPDGSLFFPWSARRGTYSLGKILRHTGFLSREALEKVLTEARSKRKAELVRAEADPAALAEAQRRQSTEELHDLFLWRDVRFEFRPEPLPPRVAQDVEAKRGLRLEPKGLLFEVARRTDERRRIRQAIPSTRVVLRGRPGAEERTIAALRAIGVDVDCSPLQGDQTLDELLEAWGIPHHAALTSLALLVEAGDAQLLAPEAAKERAREAIGQGDLRGAARMIAHLVELEHARGESRPGLERELAQAPDFRGAGDVGCRMRLGGARAFALARLLLQTDAPFGLEVHEAGRSLRLAGFPGEVLLSGDFERGADGPVPLPAAIEPEKVADRLAAELARIGWWADADVELKNRPERKALRDPQVALPLPDLEARARLVERLDRWGEVLDDVPSEELLLMPGERTAAGDPATRFFTRFDLSRNLGELRAQAKVDRLEFATFVSRGLRRQFLRRPTQPELEAALADARGDDDEPRAARLWRAARALGYEVTAPLTGHGPPPVLDPEPVLEGDLDGVGLAAILQGLRDQRRTGTLRVHAGERDEQLLFHRGDAFLLRLAEDPEAEEFAAFFLGHEGSDELEALSELAPESRDGLPSAAEVRALTDGLVDLLFLEGATFAFHQDELPPELFNPGEKARRIALDTRAFLLEAIGAMTEWDEHREAIPSRKAVLRFAPGAKASAMAAHPGQESLLLLLDGRRDLDEVLRLAGLGVLEAARILAPMVRAHELEVEGAAPYRAAGPAVADQADDATSLLDDA